ncbi:asparagine synthetase B [Candidatus Latescibacterota bacterium]
MANYIKRNIGYAVICFAAVFIISETSSVADKILIPMDSSQTDHLKAYGVAFHALEMNIPVEWLLNYRGGSFLLNVNNSIKEYSLIRGVKFEILDSAAIFTLEETIENNNMSKELLEKCPKIAVYTPPNKQPWDDAVTMAMTYAEIPYETLWDAEVLAGDINEYDWLHLHHEDFTGQYGKFYRSYRNNDWYIQQQIEYEAMAKSLGFEKVSDEKKAVAAVIREYVNNGGFVFAMCSATDTIDIALAAGGMDIVAPEFDGDGFDTDMNTKLDYSGTFAFENFTLITDPMVYEFSNIDNNPESSALVPATAETQVDYFNLFEFSAKYDPVPSMLSQNHENPIKGFMGQTTEYNSKLIKKNVVVMGENKSRGTAKYIHGNLGKGTFTFLGGHDPEDFQHLVGDPQTQLFLHKNSPGYRLILNNVLFPGAKKKELKT